MMNTTIFNPTKNEYLSIQKLAKHFNVKMSNLNEYLKQKNVLIKYPHVNPLCLIEEQVIYAATTKGGIRFSVPLYSTEFVQKLMEGKVEFDPIIDQQEAINYCKEKAGTLKTKENPGYITDLSEVF